MQIEPIPYNMWKFASIGLLLYGNSLAWLVDNNKIDKDTQSQVLILALSKLLKSIELGVKLQSNKVIEAVQKFYLIV